MRLAFRESGPHGRAASLDLSSNEVFNLSPWLES